jgi:AcrR family transcriptional regulator
MTSAPANQEPPSVADNLAVEIPPSRREERKLRTQRALQQAALDLFAKNGFEATTTDEIAERAGVSPRTFFRYFPTKESVLFVGEYGWFQSFTSLFLAQPPDLNDFEGLRATFHALAPSLAKIRPALVIYERAVSSSATLRGGVFDHQQQDIATIAKAISIRRNLLDPDKACTILATVVLVTYRRGVMNWLAGPASVDPREVIETEFDLLLTELAPTPKPRGKTPSTTK